MLDTLLRKAPGSPFYLRVLNLFLRRLIPFNAPHRIKIEHLSADAIRVSLPYRRSNLNHVRGQHACALAIASEFASGVLLLSHLRSSEFRMLMKSLQVEYHYQGKNAVIVECGISNEWIDTAVKSPLQSAESVTASVEARAYDQARNLLSTAKVVWHFKRWDAVKKKT